VSGRKILFIRAIAALVLSLGVLFAWRYSATQGCLSLVIAVIVVITVTAGELEDAMLRRYCLASCYFQHGSLPDRWLRGRTIAALRSLVLALFASSFLLLGFLVWDMTTIRIVALDALLIVGLMALFRTLSAHLFTDQTTEVVIKAWTVATNTVLVVLVLALIQFWSTSPEYLRHALIEPLNAASPEATSACALIRVLSEAYIGKDAISWSLMTKTSLELENPLILGVAWFVFLLSGALAIWAYSRFVVQIVGLATFTARDDDQGYDRTNSPG